MAAPIHFYFGDHRSEDEVQALETSGHRRAVFRPVAAILAASFIAGFGNSTQPTPS
jgi:hypothetical protein